MSKNLKTVPLIAVAAGALALSLSASAAAGTRWQAHHPWRAEVNRRLGNLNARINRERREGELTQGQAHALHGEVHAIRQTERALAARQHSHLTGNEWGALNGQENMVSRTVGR